MATAVISGRVDERVRQRADIVMRKAGLKTSDIIQSVWTYMAEEGEVPEIARLSTETGGKEEALEHLRLFLESLPPANPAYEGLSDDDILALKVHDYE